MLVTFYCPAFFLKSHYLVFHTVQSCVFADLQCDNDNDMVVLRVRVVSPQWKTPLMSSVCGRDHIEEENGAKFW